MSKRKFIEIICPIGGRTAKAIIAVVNQGIDPHLEAFTESKFSRKGMHHVFNFHVSELPLLVRRLEEMEEDESDMWAADIRALPEYREK